MHPKKKANHCSSSRWARKWPWRVLGNVCVAIAASNLPVQAAHAPDEPTRDAGEEDGKERTRKKKKRREGRREMEGKGRETKRGGRERKKRAERQRRGKIKAAEQLDENEMRKFR